MAFSMAREPSVIIVGAGIAGLAAASLLGFSGHSVTILEARNRIGGRIFTLRDPTLGVPIELGAEFIHGIPPAVVDPLRKTHARITEVEGQTWCCFHGELCLCDSSTMEEVLGKMNGSAPDESFLHFLAREFPDSEIDSATREAKRRALSYITGFEAADPALVGVHWLVHSMHAEQEIQGDRSFRSEHGYEDLVDFFRQRIEASKRVSIQTGAVVHGIDWEEGNVRVSAHLDQQPANFEAPKILITVPLEVLKTKAGKPGAIQFNPPIADDKLAALERLEMGQVIRVVLRFREQFWEKISPPGEPGHTLADMSFLFSENEWFPTWWTPMPAKYPMLTAWAPFHAAQKLSGQSSSFITQHAVETLASLLNVEKKEIEDSLQATYFHDWQSDPFSRGAYSYGKVGSDGAQQRLASPVQDTLYFAGEATDTTGHNGTVHGAIASGYRAAMEVLQALA
jgi:monoamine oxidase